MSTFTETRTITYTLRKCRECGLHYAVDSAFDRQCKEKGEKKACYCPGCSTSWYYMESEVDRLLKLVQSKDAQLDQKSAMIREQQKSLTATRGVVTRLQNRAKNGVCPCCKRSFQNLRRHMKSKHPTFADTP